MAELPRLLTIMGSGETSPTMVKVHRELIDRLGESPVPAVLLDTPVGFQENADDIAARAVEYFRESVQRPIEVASYRSATTAVPGEYERMLTKLRAARYVFAGPGSPSYALQEWRGTLVPTVLREKLHGGGAVTFASAAAVTLGRCALPVYEIYKVGQSPRWLDGLDLMTEIGLPAVVIPHYDNAEGGNHDTRFCYMGERRLAQLEELLPSDTFVLGVDEHTACILDLDEGTATVAGLGVVTVRVRGRSSVVPTGQRVTIAELRALAEGRAAVPVASPPSAEPAVADRPAPTRSPLLAAVAAAEGAFDEALARGDATGAARTVLELEQLLVDWSRDTLQSDELDRGRAVLRSLVVRLGDVAERGVADPRDAVAPLVQALLDLRAEARDDRRWGTADAIRDRLLAAGVEVQDTPEGPEWGLVS